MSQLLLRLEVESSSGSDPIARAIACARRACYLARMGRYGESTQIIRDLRSVYGDGRNGLVTVWLMLAEGVLGLFETINPAAFDRVRRAQFLAVALGDREAIAVTSAWKAHFEFESSRFESMGESLCLAMANAENASHDAQARLSMVLSNAFYLAGDRLSGQRWFMRCRDHALQDGDHAAIEALLYNRAAFNIARLRVRRCLELLPAEAVAVVRSELNSARNLQNLSTMSALPHLIDLCDARLLVLEGRFKEAIFRLKAVRHAGPFAKYNFDQSLIDLEIRYCKFCEYGRSAEANVLEVDLKSDFASMDADDQLIAAWMFKELVAQDSSVGLVEVLENRFNGCVGRYLQLIKGLEDALLPFGKM